MKKLKHLSIVLFLGFLLINCQNDRKASPQKDNQEIATQQKRKKPNIIFFIADDMYPWMFNNIPEGQTKDGKPANLTPNIDRLAKEGVWLDNMKVVSPVCTPSRYNCLTGNYASRAQNESFKWFTKKNDGQTVIQWNSFIVPGKDKTMGNYFQALGYKTGFVGKNHVIESKKQVGEAGVTFDLYADPRAPEVKKQLEYRYHELQKDIKKSGFDYAEKLYHNNPNWLGNRALAYQNNDWIAEGGVNFIRKYKDQPFMLYIASTLTHAPLDPEHSWLSDRRITARGILDKAPEVLPQYKGELSPEQKKKIEKDPGLEPTIRNIESIKRRIKAAGLEGKNKENLLWLDDALGALFKELEKQGVLDNTIIVFFNDHGQNQKGTLYEGGINSQAFIWKKGGFKVGHVLKDPVSNVDFLPTLLELAGDTIHHNFDGYSFAPALEGKPYNKRTSMYHELGYARAITKGHYKYYAVRYPKWAMNMTLEQRKDTLEKYNKFRESFGEHAISTDPTLPFGQLEMIPGGGGAEHAAYISMPHYHDLDQFYDLEKDPGEQHNLINDPKYAKIIKEMKEELKTKYLDKLPGKFDL